MIKVEATTALMLYLACFLLLCFGAWLVTHFKNRNRQVLPPLYRFSTCEYCHHHYLGKQGEQVSQCPQCGSFNKATP